MIDGQRRPLSEAQIEQRRAAGRRGGRAVVEKYGRAYMAELRKDGGGKGKGGGRPTFEQWLAAAREREALIQARRPRPGRVSKKED